MWLTLFEAAVIGCLAVVCILPAILLTQSERGTAPEHWWQQ